jgi:hypothetical protein
VADQVDGQEVGQRLGGKRSPGAAARQFGAHRRHCRPKVVVVDTSTVPQVLMQALTQKTQPA